MMEFIFRFIVSALLFVFLALAFSVVDAWVVQEALNKTGLALANLSYGQLFWLNIAAIMPIESGAAIALAMKTLSEA